MSIFNNWVNHLISVFFFRDIPILGARSLQKHTRNDGIIPSFYTQRNNEVVTYLQETTSTIDKPLSAPFDIELPYNL